MSQYTPYYLLHVDSMIKSSAYTYPYKNKKKEPGLFAIIGEATQSPPSHLPNLPFKLIEAKHLAAHTEKRKTKKKDRKVASIAVSAAGRGLFQPYRDYYCKRPILCLASSKILTPHPPLRPASMLCIPPRLCCGGRTHSPGGEGDGGGVNILEDARHRIVLLQ